MPFDSPCSARYYCRIFLAAICPLLFQHGLLADGHLESRFLTKAVEIVQKLQADDIHSTGVLKFSVRVGEGPFPKSFGNLNMRLAEKLELALVMANSASPERVAEQIGIVRSASDVANRIEGATHLTDEGRRLLFSRRYPLAWKHSGQAETVPDSLIFGMVQVHPDLSSMGIGLMLLTKNDLKVQSLGSITVPTDLDDLIDSGESFTTRGLFDDGSVEQVKADLGTKTEPGAIEQLAKQQAILVRKETLNKSEPQKSTLHPLADTSNSPITFEISYSGKRQQLEFRDGAAFVTEPSEGQDVMFTVRRRGSDSTRYGVLVRVNGENTLFRERIPNAKASIWILEPSVKELRILGYQIDSTTREQFKVLSARDSEDRAFSYGRDVGMISVVVFREGKNPEPILSEDEEAIAVVSEGKLPEKTADSRGDLGEALFAEFLAQYSNRALIVEGEKTQAAVSIVKFERNDIPVMAASIRYYNKK